MSTPIADYLVLLDQPVTLSAQKNQPHPRTKFCKFFLGNEFSPDFKPGPVLFFRTTVPSDSKDTRFRVFVNPEMTNTSSDGFPAHDDYVTSMGKGFFGLHMQALNASKFKKGQDNAIVFTISGDGTKFGDVELGDVVLLVQRLA